MKKRILVISSANVDLVLRTDTFPRAGETVVSGGGYSYLPGGKGAKTRRAQRRLSAPTRFLCAASERTGTRKKLLALYESEGIDTRFITVDRENETGMAAVISTPDGESRIIVYPGANGTLSADNVEDAFTSYPDGAFVQLEIPEEAVLAAGRFAAENGAKLIVDAGPAKPDFPFSKMGTIDIFSPNETECEAYTGICPRDGESAASRLRCARQDDEGKKHRYRNGGERRFRLRREIFAVNPGFPRECRRFHRRRGRVLSGAGRCGMYPETGCTTR